MLTTTGRKSGAPRTSPLLYYREGHHRREGYLRHRNPARGTGADADLSRIRRDGARLRRLRAPNEPHDASVRSHRLVRNAARPRPGSSS
ncbi:nitroreductase family deazaflavin-dependent oxidoreductase [Rhodococcus sp. USK10]|nr:nitroreductase family deazaflavin-dependent oxidoreductase [Rhodococcus sp. USK10]